MSALAPWFLLSGLAVGLPILFHMLRRTPRGTLPFSTLMFLQPSPPRITRRNRIEHWLLLLLRAAAIVILAVAFSRPFWRSDSPLPQEATSGRLIAILLDTSASHLRDGIAADREKQLSRKFGELGPDDRVAVFHFSDKLEEDVSLEQATKISPGESQALARSAVKEIASTFGPSHLASALIDLAQRFQVAGERISTPASQEIWLFSDLKLGAELAELQSFEWPKNLRVGLQGLGSGSPTNAGLQLVENLESQEQSQPRVRVSNSADSQRDEFTLRGFAREEPSKSSPATEPRFSMSVHVPPGESRVVALPVKDKNIVVQQVLLSGDDHPFDNTLWMIPPVIAARTVVYFGDEPADDIQQPRFYLEQVFQATGRQPMRLTTLENDDDARWFIPGVVQPTLAILTNRCPQSQADRVRGFLQAGGTILVAPSSPETMNSLLNALGHPLKVQEAKVPRFALWSEINFRHPIFAPLAEARFADFTGIHFWKHRHVKLPANSDWNVIARFDDGDPALLELNATKGRLILMTAGWHPADSQLARSSKFAPLLYQLPKSLATSSVRPLAYEVGDSVPLEVSDIYPARTDAVTITRLTNDRDATHEPNSWTVSPEEMQFTSTSRPGLYSIAFKDRTETFAVNLPPEESRTAPLPPEQLENLGVRLAQGDTRRELARQAAMERQRKTAELEQQQQFWRWLMLVALVFVIGETWLSARTQARLNAADSLDAVGSPVPAA